jgi:hypothetical protein
MTDLEMTKLCAEAMAIEVFRVSMNAPEHTLRYEAPFGLYNYWPLTTDAQAMRLVKRFHLWINYSRQWMVVCGDSYTKNADLNRAIVECVAKMQKERK